MRLSVLVLLSLLLASCANTLNLRTADRYFRSGTVDAKDGKWFNARMAFGRALSNADWGNAPDRLTAVYAYEYGRASGAICDWVEAERGLKKALELDQKTNGPVHMSLVELARMHHAKGDLALAEQEFANAKKALEGIQAVTHDPAGYANILKDYSAVLQSLGRNSESITLTRQEMEIRNSLKDQVSGHEQTPYGKHCDQRTLQ